MKTNKHFHILIAAFFLFVGAIAAKSQNTLSINSETVLPGDVVVVEVEMANAAEVVALQFDVPLPAGFTYVNESLTLSAARSTIDVHEVDANIVGTNTLRIISYSDPVTPYSGFTGILLTFELETPLAENTYTLNIENALLADENGDDVLTGVTSGNITVEKGTPDVTWPDPDPITYGQEVGNANLDGGSASYDGSPVAGSFDYDDGTVVPDAGIYTADVTFTPTDTDKYNTVEGTVNVTVNALYIEVTANSGQNKIYGAADPASFAFTVTVGALVSGDSWIGALDRDAGEHARSYAITIGTLEPAPTAANYNVHFVSNDFVINPRPIEISADAGQTKVYGEPDPLPFGYSVTGDGPLQGTDYIDGSLTRLAGENVGSYQIQLGGLHIVDGHPDGNGGNYNISYVPANLSITVRPIRITADDKGKNVGDPDPEFTITINEGSLADGPGFDDDWTGALTRVSGESVGGYPILQGTLNIADGNLGNNYDIDFTQGTLTISEREITITVAPGQSKIYGETDPAFTYINDAFAITTGSLGVGHYFDSALGRTAGNNAGTYAFNQGTLVIRDSGGFDVTAGYNISWNWADFEIEPKPITVTADPKSKVFGTSDPALTFDYNEVDLVGEDGIGGTPVRVAGETVTGSPYAINQGTVAATPVPGNYDITWVSANFTITQRVVNIAANALNKVYGDNDPVFTFENDAFEVTSGNLRAGDSWAGALTRATGEDVDTYAFSQGSLHIQDGGEIDVTANYNIGFTANNFEITARPLTINADPKVKLYGEGDPDLTFTPSVDITEYGDVWTGELSRVAGETVGPYAILQNTLAPDNAGNYNITYNGANLTIDQLPLTVTPVAGQNKIYGEEDPPLTYDVVGELAAGDSWEVTLTRNEGEDVGVYTINADIEILDGNNGNNYDVTYNEEDFTINAKPIEVTAQAKSKLYGATDPPLTYTTNVDMVGEDKFELTREPGINVAAYAITLVANNVNNNYGITYHGADLTIGPRPLTITADSDIKAESTLYTFTGDEYTHSTLYHGDIIVSVDLSSDGAPVEAVSNDYDIIVENAVIENTLSENVNNNYDINYVKGVLTVSDLIELTLEDIVVYNKVYDGENTAVINIDASNTEAHLVGIDGDHPDVGFDLSGADATFTNYNAGEGREVRVTGIELTGGDKDFYIIGTQYTVANITPRDLYLRAVAGQSKAYGEDDPAELLYELVGDGNLVDGEIIDVVSGSPARDVGENVNLYTIREGTLSADNYSIDFTTRNFEIAKRDITIGAVEKTKIYGEDDPPLEHSILEGSLAFTDVIVGSLTREEGESVGPYEILQGSLDIDDGNFGENYNLLYQSDNLTITPKELIVKAHAKSKTYGDDDPGLTYDHNEEELVGDDKLSGELARGAGEDVNTYAITIGTLTAGANYFIDFTGDVFVITPREIYVKAYEEQSKVYGEADEPFTYSVSNLAFGHEPADVITGALRRVSGRNAGFYAITIGTLGAGNNYTIDFEFADFEITKRPIEITADEKSMTYGSANIPTLTYQITYGNLMYDGVDWWDQLTCNLERDEGWDADTYTINMGTLSVEADGVDVTGNYNISFINGNFIINQRGLTITADDIYKPVGTEHLFDNTEYTHTEMRYDDAIASVSITSDGAGIAAVVGDYDIVVSDAVGEVETNLDNYNIEYVNGTMFVRELIEVTVTNLYVENRIYDGTDVADVLNYSTATLSGVEPGDNVFLDASDAVATFEDKNVSPDKLITVTGLKLEGDDAFKYYIQEQTTTANINRRNLVLSNFHVEGKVYDGTTDVVGDHGFDDNRVVIDDVPDNLEFDYNVAFRSANVGEARVVDFDNIVISGGDDMGNYNLQTADGEATTYISKKDLHVINAVAEDKVYDGNTDAVITGAELDPDDIVAGDETALNLEDHEEGVFAQATVGVGITVETAMTLTGAAASNYNLVGPDGLTADITAKGLHVIDAVAQNKTYDGDANAVITGATLNPADIVAGDEAALELGNHEEGNFVQVTVGTGIEVETAMALTGAAAPNYSLVEPALTADITAKELTIGGSFTVENKEYDSTTDAAIDENNLELIGKVDGDDVGLVDVVAEFVDEQPGQDIEVVIVDGGLAGVDKDNYTLSLDGAPTTTADITETDPGINIVIIHDVGGFVSEPVTIDVEVQNENEFVAFQMDFAIPEGFAYVTGSAILSDRADGHTLSANVLEGNVLRILSYSGANAEYSGNSGVLVSFDLDTPDEEGEWEIIAENVALSSRQSENIYTGSEAGTIILEERGEETFTVTFVVEDEDGDEISNAVVTFDDIENDEGDYVFANIEPGTYNFTVSAEGYEDAEGSVKVTDKDVVKAVVLEEEEDDPDDTYVDTHDGFELSIYPNPARNKVNVESSITIKQVRLMDVNGQVIYEKVIDGLNAEVYVNNLLTGIYFLQVHTDEGISTRRIQVIR